MQKNDINRHSYVLYHVQFIKASLIAKIKLKTTNLTGTSTSLTGENRNIEYRLFIFSHRVQTQVTRWISYLEIQ